MANQTLNETELLLRMADGDTAVMRSVFDLYYTKLRFYAASIILNEEDARDIAQDALLQCWNHRAQFAHQQQQQLSAWLFTVVRRDCLDYLKHQKVKTSKQEAIASLAPLTAGAADHRIILTEVLSLIYEEIDKLPGAMAEIVRLSYLEELSADIIAEKLNMTSNHVRVQKSRAIEKLRNALLKRHLEAPVLLSLILLEIFQHKTVMN